jgi:probable HAF family extracellular repeat protein
MKRFQLTFALAFALMLCSSAFAQQTYNFRNVVFGGDPNVSFTQLLGINNSDIIAGYHNFQQNQGFTLALPNAFTTENFPNSMMTQVIGINNSMTTDGFYVDNGGITHGFFRTSSGRFTTVDYPSAIAPSFNQLLSQNDYYQAAGYYSNSLNNTTPDIPYTYDELGGVFHVITIPGAVGGAQATGINNAGVTCGFFIDGNGVNHGWLIYSGIFMPLDVPDSSGTQALGLNNRGQVVGFFTDAAGLSHGFVYSIGTASFVTVDDPNGVGTTIVNGINDAGKLVGFYGTAPVNTGFVATPSGGSSDTRSAQTPAGRVVEPPSHSPSAIDRGVPPSSDGLVGPPSHSPNAVRGR